MHALERVTACPSRVHTCDRGPRVSVSGARCSRTSSPMGVERARPPEEIDGASRSGPLIELHEY